MQSARPAPVPDESSAGYWEAAARGALALAACCRCERLAVPPPMVCPACGTTDPQWSYRDACGGGAVRSWTVVRDAFLPGFDPPYVLVDVELDAQPGLRLIARLLDDPDVTLHLGDRVEVAFDDTVPAFRLAARQ